MGRTCVLAGRDCEVPVPSPLTPFDMLRVSGREWLYFPLMVSVSNHLSGKGWPFTGGRYEPLRLLGCDGAAPLGAALLQQVVAVDVIDHDSWEVLDLQPSDGLGAQIFVCHDFDALDRA